MPTFKEGGNPNPDIFRQGEQIGLDFEELKKSGELDDTTLSIIQTGYPGAPIVYMGGVPGGVAIGIKTGDTVYPKNTFLLSPELAKRVIKKLN